MLLGGGLTGLPGVVAAASADLHAAESLGFHFHPHRAIAALGLRFDRLVSDGVLVANVVRNVLRDLVDFVEVAREEGDTAGALGKRAQSTLVALFARLVVTEDPNGVDYRPILILDVTHSLLKRHAA